MTYRETVHHQFIGSMANLAAVAAGRRELLRDYHKVKTDNLRRQAEAYVFLAGANRSRLDRMVETLQRQNIEVLRTTRDTRLAHAQCWDGSDTSDVAVAAGSAIVRTDQPLRQLIDAILEFDNRIASAFLETEKKEILARNDSRLYDATGWSLPLAYAIDSYHVTGVPGVDTEPYVVRAPAGSLPQPDARVGFAFDGNDDRAFDLLARLFEADVRVWCARKPFRAGDIDLPRGSFLIRRAGNPSLDVERLAELAGASGVTLHGVDRGLAAGGFADAGGNDFTLLEAPRIALVAGSGVSTYGYGAVWHLLDSRLRVRTSTIDIDRLARSDLGKYNVLYLPDHARGVDGYKGSLGESGLKRLKAWVDAGGTVVAEGAGAAMLADTSVAIASTRMRRQILKKRAEYDAAAGIARDAMNPKIDSLSLWEARVAETKETKKNAAPAPTDAAVEQADEIARKLAPRGVIVAVDVDTEHWLGFGCNPVVPALLIGNRAFATRSVQVPARLAPEARLRLSGLLWEEARARWAQTPYLTRDGVGSGQVILFVSQPNFRGYYHGTERMLLNAMMLGPGMGASRPTGW
jgi:hypothetical protein